jgi:hypothetical protein
MEIRKQRKRRDDNFPVVEAQICPCACIAAL